MAQRESLGINSEKFIKVKKFPSNNYLLKCSNNTNLFHTTVNLDHYDHRANYYSHFER